MRVRIPADLDTPDRVVFGLTLRQLCVVAAFAAPAYLAWKALAGVVPLPVLAGGTAPLAALALALAVGRRDGLPLDAWLLAALRHGRQAKRQSPSGRADQAGRSRPGGRSGRAGRVQRVGLLRLPASEITADGVITAQQPSHQRLGRLGSGDRTQGGGSAAAVVAVRTITSGLHTVAEQAALLGGYARWLNGLSGPVQVVVSSSPVGLPKKALGIARDAAGLPHPALAQAAVEHAEHLLDLCENGEPRARTVTVVCAAPSSAPGAGGPGARGEALRRAQRTAAALGALGAGARVLDGGQVTGLLAHAADAYGPGGPWPRSRPGTVVTGSARAAHLIAGGPLPPVGHELPGSHRIGGYDQIDEHDEDDGYDGYDRIDDEEWS